MANACAYNEFVPKDLCNKVFHNHQNFDISVKRNSAGFYFCQLKNHELVYKNIRLIIQQSNSETNLSNPYSFTFYPEKRIVVLGKFGLSGGMLHADELAQTVIELKEQVERLQERIPLVPTQIVPTQTDSALKTTLNEEILISRIQQNLPLLTYTQVSVATEAGYNISSNSEDHLPERVQSLDSKIDQTLTITLTPHDDCHGCCHAFTESNTPFVPLNRNQLKREIIHCLSNQGVNQGIGENSALHSAFEQRATIVCKVFRDHVDVNHMDIEITTSRIVTYGNLFGRCRCLSAKACGLLIGGLTAVFAGGILVFEIIEHAHDLYNRLQNS